VLAHMLDRISLSSRLKNFLPFFYGWVVVGASSTAIFARMAPNITTLTIFIFPLSQQFGWSRTLISGSVSAGALAALVLSPVVGWCIDKFGARPVLIISVLVMGVAMISMAWATIPLTFYVAFASARVIFHTSAPIGASTVSARWFIRKRGRAIGVVFLGGAIGGLIFTMLAAQMIDHYSMKAAWITIGVVVLVVSLAPCLLLVVERPEDMGLFPDNDMPATDDDPDHGSNSITGPTMEDSWSLSEAMRTKSFWVLFFMGMAMFCVNTGTNVHIGAYYRDQGLSLTLAAVAISFSWLVSAFGSVVWGWVLEKIEARYAYSMVFIILGVSTAYLLSVNSTAEALVAAGLIGSVSSGSNVIISILYANYYGRNSLGRIRGVSETGVLLGQSVGPLLAGILFDTQGSYSFVFVLFSGIALACSVIVLAAKPPVRPIQARTPQESLY
jgi:OFA family oxalate/formate antiporter-like MFS transporter